MLFRYVSLKTYYLGLICIFTVLITYNSELTTYHLKLKR